MKGLVIGTLVALACAAGDGMAQETITGSDCSHCGKGLLRHPCSSYHGIRCYNPPPPEPCVCEDSCSKGHPPCLPWYGKSTAKLLDQLSDCHYRCRADAAHKLACRFHADHCCNPEIVPALVHTLQCDSCWVVRREAARALGYQVVADEYAWTALVLASRLDPHYLVREQAADSLMIIQTQISPACVKEWREAALELEKAVKKHYKPGKEDCHAVFSAFSRKFGSLTTSVELLPHRRRRSRRNPNGTDREDREPSPR